MGELGLTVHDQYRQMSLTLCWNGAILYAAALDSVSATWAYDDVVNPHALVDPIVCAFAMALHVSAWLPNNVVAHLDVGFYNAASTRVTPFHKQSYAMIFGHEDAVKSVGDDALEVVTSTDRNYSAFGDDAALAVVRRTFEQVGFAESDLMNIPGFDEHGKYVLS